MPTTDPIKNLMYVKKSQALKKEMIGIDAFKEIHAGEQQKYRDNLRKEKGDEAYRKQQAEYMKAYRQAKKAAKAQQPQQVDIKTPAANILQNAFRNKISRNAVLKQKQDKANELISQINQQKTARDLNELKTKLNASVIVNDMLNQLIPSTINLNYPIKPIGRPRISDEEKARRELQKLQKPKKPVGRPRQY
jgi:CHAT domain-containing protein